MLKLLKNSKLKTNMFREIGTRLMKVSNFVYFLVVRLKADWDLFMWRLVRAEVELRSPMHEATMWESLWWAAADFRAAAAALLTVVLFGFDPFAVFVIIIRACCTLSAFIRSCSRFTSSFSRIWRLKEIISIVSESFSFYLLVV